MTNTDLHSIMSRGTEILGCKTRGLSLVPQEYGRKGRPFRELFDAALSSTHYAGSCQRVGRCMRLAIVADGNWVGGVVLGSTFPNVGCRDEALGLKQFVQGRDRASSRSPWAAENTGYWSALQGVVNHARTFVFPEFQGRGIGISAHELLPTMGINVWRQRYAEPVWALDTLCDQGDSGLFRRNGWQWVGRTKGYTSDTSTEFSVKQQVPGLRNNVGLRLSSRQWEVWVRSID